MLHILLTILKVIGIIVLVILALLLALILIVLFVPLRYLVRFRKEEKGSPEAEGRITWLFGLIRLEVSYRDKKGQAVLRVLRFRIRSMQFPEDAGNDGKADDDTARVKAAADAVSGSGVSGRAQSPDGDRTVRDTSGGEQLHGTQEPLHSTEEESDSTEEKTSEESSGLSAVLKTLPGRAVEILEKILDFLLRLLHLPSVIPDMIDDRAARVDKKISMVRTKAEPFLSVEAEHMLRKLIRYLRYLIDGWKPRKVKGYLEFGTGQPDLTGKLTGLMYVLLPAGADSFELNPDFYDKKLCADVTVSGRIRMYRLVWVGIRLLVDREFWDLVRLIRHKPPKKKRKRTERRRKTADR